MIKIFKNYTLSVFMTMTLFFSHVVSTNANHLNNSYQRVDSFISAIKQERSRAMSIAALYVPSLNYGVENETATEGKIEKVFEPVTIGAFGFGIAAGYGATTVGAFIGWVIAKIIQLIRAAHA
ncbi:hypothetical protein V3565_01595 [Bartonella sp. B10]